MMRRSFCNVRTTKWWPFRSKSFRERDREFLKSKEAGERAGKVDKTLQNWTLRDGTKIVGRIVEYAERDVTLQRRRGRIYVNDRLLDNLPEFYQQLVPKVVAHLENLQRDDRRSLEAWLVRQRGQPKTFHLEGVVLETENGDEYAVPFFMFSDENLKVLKPGWSEWQATRNNQDYEGQEDHAFLLRSLAAARHRDQQVAARDRDDAAQAAGRSDRAYLAVGGDALSKRGPRRSAIVGRCTGTGQSSGNGDGHAAKSGLFRRACSPCGGMIVFGP